MKMIRPLSLLAKVRTIHILHIYRLYLSSKLEADHRAATIESVLDVDDDDAYSKDKAPCHRFSRSILVLTPQGAFKFNALSAGGHFSWLVALSYVSQSCRDPGF